MKRRFFALPIILILSLFVCLTGCDTDTTLVIDDTASAGNAASAVGIGQKRLDSTTAAYRYGGYLIRGNDTFARVRVEGVSVTQEYGGQTRVVEIGCTVLEDCYGTLKKGESATLALRVPSWLLEQTDGEGDGQESLAAEKLAGFLRRWDELFVYLNTQSTVSVRPEGGCIVYNGYLLGDPADGCIIPVTDHQLNLTAMNDFLTAYGLSDRGYPADIGQYGTDGMSVNTFSRNIRQLRQDVLASVSAE